MGGSIIWLLMAIRVFSPKSTKPKFELADCLVAVLKRVLNQKASCL